MCLKALPVVFFLLHFASCELELPSYFPQCYRNDPDLSKCLIDATESVREYLKKGVPELNIPEISPFHIPEVSLEQGTKALNYKAKLTNILVKGFDTYKFTKYDVTPDLKHFDCHFDVEHVDIDGNYSIDGKILLVQIRGNGKVHSNMSGISVQVTMDLDLTTKNNMQYYVLKKIEAKMDVKDSNLYFDGLFDGDKAVDELVHKVIGENMPVLLKEFTPALERVVERLIEENIYKSIFKVSFDKLLPVK